jgi:hypothetical protein
MPLVFALALFAAVLALLVAARRALTVCVIDVRSGQARVVRGGLARGVLTDVEDVVARPAIARATLRIVRSQGHAQLEIEGDVSDVQQQRLRNVIGSVPLAKLANARRR